MAAAWVTLRHLGQDGYLKLAKNLQNTVKILIDGCNKIEVHRYFFANIKLYIFKNAVGVMFLYPL